MKYLIVTIGMVLGLSVGVVSASAPLVPASGMSAAGVNQLAPQASLPAVAGSNALLGGIAGSTDLLDAH